MIFFYSTFLFLILVITYKKNRTILKPNIILSITWCFFASISTFSINGLNPPSLITHIYIISFIFFFNFIYLIISPNRFIIDTSIEELSSQFRYRLIYFLNISSWIFMIPIIMKAYFIIMNYGYSSIRNYTFVKSDMLVDGIDKFIAQVIVHGIFQATVLIAMINIVAKKKTHFLTVCALVNVIIYTFVFAGRFEILELIIYYILAYIFIKKIEINSKQKKRLSYSLLIVTVLGLVFITIFRGSNNFILSFFSYFVGPFTFLDYILHNPAIFHLDDYLWGAATFGIISEPIVLIMKMLGGNQDIVSYYINITTQPFYEISPGKYFNALTTALYPFIRDFGYFGIFIGAFVLASLCGILETTFMKRKKIVYLCLYIHVSYVVFNSILLYDFLSYPTVAVLLFIIIFSTGKKGKSITE